MSSAISSVIIASAQSVAKVYVIGAVGYFSVLCKLQIGAMDRQLTPSYDVS
jgi:hypothetical protein